MGTPQPLYVYHNSNDFVSTAAGTSEFHLEKKEQIELFCSDGFRPPLNKMGGNVSTTLTATCIGGKKFTIAKKSIELVKATCNSYPNHTTVVSQNKCSAGFLIEIGFNMNGAWLPVLEVCHDRKIDSTKWVHHEIKPNNVFHQRSVPRIMFIQGDFYHGLQTEILYTKSEQRKTLGNILKSQKLADELISTGDSYFYLSRGHLAAKADYIFASHQMATFYFINAAPQWQSFNGGNWQAIEMGVRKIVAKRNVDTDVYTGTHDVVTYKDVDGIDREFYLASNGTHQRIPVPRFYYKAIIAKSINAGIVFVGINDPYMTMEQINEKYIICPDVGDQVDYINWQRKNITAGYSYACSVNDFVKVVKALPDLLAIKKLLL